MVNLFLRALDAHPALPSALLERLLCHALHGSSLALCLHRVKFGSGPLHGAPEMMMPAEELDRLLELLIGANSGEHFPLLVSFDDGYADAAEYIRSRLSRFPEVEWALFLCPEKLEKRAGYRWDLGEGDPRSKAFGPPHDIQTENDRAELVGLADRADCRLLTIDECRNIAQSPRVFLGNHTNCHFKHSELTPEASRGDIFRSRDDFRELFGSTEHFAFPFGTPGKEFHTEHAQIAAEAGYSYLWSTEPRPYLPAERVPSAVLPRFPVFGSWPAKKYAAFIAASAARFRIRERIKKSSHKSGE